MTSDTGSGDDSPVPVDAGNLAETTTPQGVSARTGSFPIPSGLRQSLVYGHFEASFSSVPMPSPEPLERLAALHPEAPKIVFEQWVSQSKHREALETAVIATKNRLAERGQLIGGFIGAIGLLGSFVAIIRGHDWAGTVIAGGCVLGLTSIFVLGKEAQRNDLTRKADIHKRMTKGEPVESLEATTGTKKATSKPPPKNRGAKK